MSFQNMFGRPQCCIQRDQIFLNGQLLQIVAYAEGKTSIGGTSVEPNSVVFHHSTLLLKVIPTTTQSGEPVQWPLEDFVVKPGTESSAKDVLFFPLVAFLSFPQQHGKVKIATGSSTFRIR